MATSFLRLLSQTMDAYPLCNRHEWVAQLRTMMNLGLLSEEQARGYLYAVHAQIPEWERSRNSLPRAPSPEEMYPQKPPDLVFADLVETDASAGLFLHDNMSIILAGNAGSGKTTAIYNLILAVDQHNQAHPDDFISLIVYEKKEGELLAVSQVLDNCLVTSTAETLHVGLDPPANVPSHVYNGEMGRIIASRGGLKHGGITVVEMLNLCSRVLNPIPTSDRRLAASFENLYEMCDRAPPGLFESKEQYMLSVKQVLRQPARGTGHLFRTNAGANIEDDVIAQNKHLLIDDRGFDNWVGDLARDILLKRLMLGRQYGQGKKVPRVFFLGDEFGNYISREAEKQYEGTMPPIECFRMARSLRISVGVGVNALGPLARTALVDANYHAIFRMKDQESLREAANTLLLPHGAEAILPAL